MLTIALNICIAHCCWASPRFHMSEGSKFGLWLWGASGSPLDDSLLFQARESMREDKGLASTQRSLSLSCSVTQVTTHEFSKLHKV